MAASGRKQSLRVSIFQALECPLSVKADIQLIAAEKATYERPERV
jgi:hypothetical protein